MVRVSGTHLHADGPAVMRRARIDVNPHVDEMPGMHDERINADPLNFGEAQ
jgi:hypothetical protein